MKNANKISTFPNLYLIKNRQNYGIKLVIKVLQIIQNENWGCETMFLQMFLQNQLFFIKAWLYDGSVSYSTLLNIAIMQKKLNLSVLLNHKNTQCNEQNWLECFRKESECFKKLEFICFYTLSAS